MSQARPLRHDALPPPTRRGLHREEAAAYVGVSPVHFDSLVAEKLMPGPLKLKGRNVWDLRALDRSFDSLPRGDESPQNNPWDN